MSKAAMNLQDSFLNQVRRENSEVRVLLVNGTLLRGTVKGFDNFTLILNNRNGQHLIYKHAVAQIVTHRPHLKSDDLRHGDEPGTAENEAAEHDGSEGKELTDSSSEVLPADDNAPQQETEQKATSPRPAAPGGDRPAKSNAPRGDRPPRQNAPQGDRPPRQNAPQGDKSPKPNSPQGNRPPRTNAPVPQGADQNSRPKPKKEGFNTLDLSSVKLEETKS